MASRIQFNTATVTMLVEHVQHACDRADGVGVAKRISVVPAVARQGVGGYRTSRLV